MFTANTVNTVKGESDNIVELITLHIYPFSISKKENIIIRYLPWIFPACST